MELAEAEGMDLVCNLHYVIISSLCAQEERGESLKVLEVNQSDCGLLGDRRHNRTGMQV